LVAAHLDLVSRAIVIGVVDHARGEPQDASLNRFERRQIDVVHVSAHVPSLTRHEDVAIASGSEN
jgi:hypothetical protein